MRRRVRIVLAMALAVAIVATAGAIVFRIPIAEMLLTAAMRAKGVPAPHLSVIEMGWDSSRIGDIRLGQAGELAVRSMRLDHSLSGLLAGRLDSIAVDGLAIVLDLTGDAPPLGSLQALLSGGDGARGDSMRLPPLTLDDVQVDARTSGGTIRTVGGGQVETADDGGISIEISLQEIMFRDRAIASGRLSANLATAEANATLALRATAGGAAADVNAVIEDPLGTPVWHLNLVAEAGAESPLWAALALPVPQLGRARLTVAGEGRAAPLSELATADDRLMHLLVNQATGTLDFSVTDVSVRDRVAGLDARVHLLIEAAEGVANVRLPEDAILAATRVSPGFLQDLGIPSDFAAQIEQGFAARLRPSEGDDPVAVASFDGDAAILALNGTLHLIAPQVADLEMTLPADLRIERSRVRGQLRRSAKLKLAQLRYGGVAELLEPAVITVAGAEVTAGHEPPALDYRVILEGPALRLRLHRPDADALDATIIPGQIVLTPGRAEIADAEIEIPAYGLVVDGLSATVADADDETHIELEIANLRQTDANPLVAPIAVAGQATRKGTVWQGSATGKGPDGIGLIRASGSHNDATAQGKAHVVVEPLIFTPGGAQPGALIPALSSLQRATGSASGEADLVWTPQGLQGSGTLALADLGFDSPWARVAGLDLGLHLDSLIPPGSPPAQTLRIRRLEPGLPLDRLDIRFQIQPSTPAKLSIENGEVYFGSGRLALSDLVVDPAATEQHVDLRVENLSLAELFAILDMEGLSGDGLLSGTIPIDITDGIVVIENGRLAAGGPGTIRFRSEQAAQFLDGQGESLDLVLRALEDFHYEKLTIVLEKSADDVGRMTLGLLGKNPAVLEGHPFQFNINIETDTGKLVTALTTIFQVPNDLLRRTWTSAR